METDVVRLAAGLSGFSKGRVATYANRRRPFPSKRNQFGPHQHEGRVWAATTGGSVLRQGAGSFHSRRPSRIGRGSDQINSVFYDINSDRLLGLLAHERRGLSRRGSLRISTPSTVC